MAQAESPDQQLDGDMNDSLMAEESQRESTSSNKESRKLVKNDVGEIGYWNKNSIFQPMMNFSVECVGYVVENLGSTSANGFLFRVVPKGGVIAAGNQNDEER